MMTIAQNEATARACHEANRAYCISNGDYSQPAWDDAPQWQTDSARNGVQFHLDYPHAGPVGSHDNWMKGKLAEGWVYGETKDTEAKTHHCLVPYEELPLEQRMKDSIFVATFKAFRNAFAALNAGDNQ